MKRGPTGDMGGCTSNMPVCARGIPQPPSICWHLRGEVDGGDTAEAGRYEVAVVHLRVEVQGDFRRQFGAPEVQIRQASAVPPVPEHLMVIGPVAEVVELEAESGAGKAVRPDLGVLAMASLRMGAPLLRQVLSDPAVPPGKGVLTVADDLEWLVPPGVPAGAVVEPEHHQKEALEEQVAISADRVHLQPPRLGAVGSPSGHVVLAPALAWDQRVVLGG